MTLDNAPSPVPEQRAATVPAWQARSELELYAQQLCAIDRFHRSRHLREETAAAVARSRELRMDAVRSRDVLRRQHEALVARAHVQLQDSVRLLRDTAERRVVVAHRNDWFRSALAGALEDGSVRVVAGTDNGADAVGLIVAEQPDLVLVEDSLTMLPGVEVIREVRRFAPQTVVTAQVAHGHRVVPLREAGAATVFARAVPPDEVALCLLQLVGAG